MHDQIMPGKYKRRQGTSPLISLIIRSKIDFLAPMTPRLGWVIDGIRGILINRNHNELYKEAPVLLMVTVLMASPG